MYDRVVWISRLAAVGTAMMSLSSCRLSPVRQTLSELARQIDRFPGCDTGVDAFTVRAAAEFLRAQDEPEPQGRYSVRGFLLPNVEGCTEIGCPETNPCCNGCGI